MAGIIGSKQKNILKLALPLFSLLILGYALIYLVYIGASSNLCKEIATSAEASSTEPKCESSIERAARGAEVVYDNGIIKLIGVESRQEVISFSATSNSGAYGVQGIQGADGAAGAQGAAGANGRDGKQGPIGETGQTGAVGPIGPQGPAGGGGGSGVLSIGTTGPITNTGTATNPIISCATCLVGGATLLNSAGDTGTSAYTNGATITFIGGTGLSTLDSGTGSITVSLDNTSTTTGSFGSASSVSTFTVDAQGRLTAAGSTPIAITAGQITAGTLSAARGGTGVDSSSATNGSLLIGNGTGYSLSTLTASTGIGITNASGSITLANTGLLSIGTTGPITNSGTATNPIIDCPTCLSSAISGDIVPGTGITSTGVLTGRLIGLGNVGLSLESTGVSSGSYGSSGSVATFSVDEQGRLNTAGDIAIAIDASQVTSGALAVSFGGTNNTVIGSANSLAYSDGSAYQFTATPTASGDVLYFDGTGLVWGNLLSGTVSEVLGTENQVLVNGTFGTGQSGSITLTLPQDVNTTSTPTFAGITSGSLTSSAGLSIGSDSTSALSIDSGTTGPIDIGTGANQKTITIGNTTSATAVNIAAGTGGVNIADQTSLNTSNFGTAFSASDTNPTCAAGDYKIYADLSETKLKKCQDGTVTDVASDDKYESFTSDGTYIKPTGTIMMIIQAWGGGGGGGGGAGGTSAAARTGGGGGGGGGYSSVTYTAGSFNSLAITLGSAGTAGTAGTNAVGGNGGAGGNTCISLSASCAGTVYQRAYGGGGGGGAGAAGNGGGGGGGSLAVGGNSSTATGATGGAPLGGGAGLANSGSGGGGGATAAATPNPGGAAYIGGSGGGASSSTGAGNSGAGGGGIFGGNGGGGGGSCAITTCTTRQGGTGGAPYNISGGGGAGGTNTLGFAGFPGSNGSGNGGGGGGGGASRVDGPGGAGATGGNEGGGGGGGGAAHTGSTVGGIGGVGGKGEARIYSIKGTGSDVAEIYGTNETLQPGEVVCIDSSMRAGVKKCMSRSDPTAIGVVTTEPGLVIGSLEDAGASSVAIVLSGRAPVLVSTENGPIKQGDLLTPSSTPGVAMKATKAGQVIGQAIGPYDGVDIGMTLTFVKSSNSLGSTAGILESLGQTTPSTSSAEYGLSMLSYVTNESSSIGVGADISEIYTDRVVAGLEIIAPQVTTNNLSTNSITSATGLDLDINLKTAGSLFIKDSLGTTVASIDDQGNANFNGTITVDKLRANQIEGLEILTNQISSLAEAQRISGLDEPLPSGNSTNPGSTPQNTNTEQILRALFAGGIFTGDTEFMANVTFRANSTFTGLSVFQGSTSFDSEVVFSADSAGESVVAAGETQSTVVFSKSLLSVPIVTLSPQDYITGQYRVINATKDGFVIETSEPQTSNIKFNWSAVQKQ